MKDKSISRFWDNFINKSKCYGVTDKTVRWHVIHAERYIKAHEGLRLQEHGPEQIEQYLSKMGRNPKLEDWQFRQIITSLQILFVELVKTEWAKAFPWQEHLEAAVSLPHDHPTVVRVIRDRPRLI